MIAKEFDKMFDNGEDIGKYIDYNSPLTKEDLIKMLKKREDEQLTIEITKELRDRLEEKAKIFNYFLFVNKPES